jgi:ribosomal protein S9
MLSVAVRALLAREAGARAAAAMAETGGSGGAAWATATATARAIAVPSSCLLHTSATANAAVETAATAAATTGGSKAATAGATVAKSGGGKKPPQTPAASPREDRRPAYNPEDATGPGARLFSIRPSALSPLHAQHRENEVLAERADFAALTLVAQARLASAVDAGRAAAAATTTSGSGRSANAALADALAARRLELERAADAYERLLAAAGPAPAPSQVTARTASGYWALLEQQTQERDGGCLELARVLEGDRSVWDYWFEDFERRYAGLPSLPPLERLFGGGGEADAAGVGAAGSAPNSEAEARALRREARARLDLPPPQPRQPRVDALGRARGLGRRKTAVAQAVVWRRGGEGDEASSSSSSASSTIVVNRRPVDDFFPDVHARAKALRPLLLAGAVGSIDAAVRVLGGGTGGQAGAVAHALARALQALDPGAYRPSLRASGLLKRDPRMVERKKPGRKKARKGFTWVKR